MKIFTTKSGTYSINLEKVEYVEIESDQLTIYFSSAYIVTLKGAEAADFLAKWIELQAKG